MVVGLNPYSNGMLSDLKEVKKANSGEARLNPYSNGMLSDS